MVRHEQIKAAIAEALRDSEDIRSYCVANFGRGALVIVNWFGSDGEPGEDEAPFIVIRNAQDNNATGFVDEETYKVEVTVGGVDAGDEPKRVETTERTATANGLVSYGIADKVENFRALVESAIINGSFGAAVRTSEREEVGTQDFPLEWVRFTVEFFEPETL